MGRIITCTECSRAYNGLEELEDLRDNDGICLACNAPIAVPDWDRVLSSYEDDEDLDDLEEDLDEDLDGEAWTGDVEIIDVVDEDDEDEDLDDFFADR